MSSSESTASPQDDDGDLAYILGILPRDEPKTEKAPVAEPTDPRELFFHLLEREKQADIDIARYLEVKKGAYLEHLRLCVKARYPGRKFDPERAEGILDAKDYESNRDVLLEESRRYRNERLNEKAQCQTRREDIAGQVVINYTTTPIVYARFFDSSYSTQVEPSKYAEARAKLCQHVCHMNSVPATIERFGHSPSGEYRVMIPIEESDLEVLRARKDVGLVESVRLCWKYGVNPRVFWPVPHGFEERNGFDMFGNWTAKKSESDYAVKKSTTSTTDDEEPTPC